MPRVAIASSRDGARAWLIVAAAFCVYLTSVGLQYVTGIFYKAWRAEEAFASTPPATCNG